MSGTGESDNDLRKILDLTRLLSVGLLLLHYYVSCYAAFENWGFTSSLTYRIIHRINATGLFENFHTPKLLSLLFLAVGLMGTQGKKDPSKSVQQVFILFLSGAVLFVGSLGFFYLSFSTTITAVLYISTSIVGYLLLMQAGTLATRFMKTSNLDDIFNEENETFPQEERLLTNEYSINFKAQYRLRNKTRSSWINIINPFRGLLVTGTPGAGKSWFVILPAMKQMIEKGYAMFIYDFKYPDLSKPAYNWMLKYADKYGTKPSFYSINFDDLSVSNRCNPLDPASMHDITDATEASRIILLGLNREWIKKQGDFFVESAINFLACIIWYLRKYKDGKYCTLPHVLELMQAEYDDLLPLLNSEPEIEVLVNPFIQAYQSDVREQLDGQIASAKIALARLSSPQLYWVLSGNDFTLDINNPEAPKIVCMGNNPEKQGIYGAALSLYVSRLIRIINKKDRQKCALIFDEFPTIYFNNMDSLIATARSNKVATILGMQDFSQLRKDYGKDQADVIGNICGNVISGQIFGDTAKLLSDRFGKILQEKENVSINRMDTSISKSRQLEAAIPASKIATLSSGEFVGMIADNPMERIKLKMFHAEIFQIDKIKHQESKKLIEIPSQKKVDYQQIHDNYNQVKLDLKTLIDSEINRLMTKEK
jgi:uncharacterized membrane protein YgdD (TMEM256/DUF423 family)